MGEVRENIQISEAIKNWDDEDAEIDLEDLLHEHFEETRLRDWPDIANEALRLWRVMFDSDIEKFSPIDNLICAACAQVENGTIDAMASMMGVDKEGLHSALSYWIEGNGEPYSPIKSTELSDLIERVKKDEEEDN